MKRFIAFFWVSLTLLFLSIAAYAVTPTSEVGYDPLSNPGEEITSNTVPQNNPPNTLMAAENFSTTVPEGFRGSDLNGDGVSITISVNGKPVYADSATLEAFDSSGFAAVSGLIHFPAKPGDAVMIHGIVNTGPLAGYHSQFTGTVNNAGSVIMNDGQTTQLHK